MNHGFIDGNKPAAYACLELFLQSNGVDIAAGNAALDTFIYGNLDAGTFQKGWLRLNTQQLD